MAAEPEKDVVVDGLGEKRPDSPAGQDAAATEETPKSGNPYFVSSIIFL